MNYGRGPSESRLVALFQELRERGLRVAFDNQAFLFRPPFILSCNFSFLRHFVLLSQMFLAGEKLVPRLGVGPRWLIKPRECKSRLSSSSSTGAKSVMDVGAVMPLKESPAPTSFRPSSAALNLSSYCSSLCTRTCLNGGAQHANHRFKDLAVIFREVRWVLDKAIWYAWQRQALKSGWNFGPRFAGHIFMGQVRSGLWFWPSILSRCRTQCSRFSSRDVRRECYSRFGERLNEEAERFCEPLATGDAIILERFFQFRCCPLFQVQFPNNWYIRLRQMLKQALLELLTIFPEFYKLTELCRSFAVFIYQTKKPQTRNQGGIVSSGKCSQNATSDWTAWYGSVGECFDAFAENVVAHIRGRLAGSVVFHGCFSSSKWRIVYS